MFDGSGELLYVGISLQWPTRVGTHRREKPWWHEVRTVTIEALPTVRDALAAERWAIRKELPRHNRAGVDAASPSIPPAPPLAPSPSRIPWDSNRLLVNIAEAAQVFGCTQQAVRARIYRGELPVVRIGRSVRLFPKDVLAAANVATAVAVDEPAHAPHP